MIRAAYLPPSHRLLRPSPPTLDARTVVVVEDVVLNRVDERNDVTPVARVTAIEFTIVRRSFDHRDYSRVSARARTTIPTRRRPLTRRRRRMTHVVDPFDRSIVRSKRQITCAQRSIDRHDRHTHRQVGARGRKTRTTRTTERDPPTLS